jgi:hypothetical protein
VSARGFADRPWSLALQETALALLICPGDEIPARTRVLPPEPTEEEWLALEARFARVLDQLQRRRINNPEGTS